MSELPEGWTEVRAGDVLGLRNGYAFKPRQWSNTGKPIIRIQNLNDLSAPFNHFEGELPAKFRVRTGDLLFAWSGTPGTSFGAHIWQRGDAWLNQHIFRVEFDASQFDKHFLRLAINRNLAAYIEQAHGGAGLAHITKRKFDDSMLRTPPLAEQRRIVERVDALSRCVSRAETRIKRFGAGTRGAQRWLFDALIGEMAYDEKALGELIGEGPQNGIYKPATSYGTGTLIIRIDDFGADGHVRRDLQRLRLTSEEIAKYELRPGDLLINRVNSRTWLGKSMVFSGAREPVVFESNMMRLRVDPDQIRPEFLGLFLRAPSGRQRLRANAKDAVNQSSINQDDVRAVPCPLPPLAAQLRLCELHKRAENVLAGAASRGARAERAVARVRDSILAKAFAGELVPTEAELARREGRRYEPASVLLERIRAERQQAESKPKVRGRAKATSASRGARSPRR